ncbi:DUF397 domain-containing protein [Streptomyces niveus]|uniref:DUF397 domain-containing protein n=1 Tax=Streptomyces niveus TaxID=193462 RepID=UPI003439342C
MDTPSAVRATVSPTGSPGRVRARETRRSRGECVEVGAAPTHVHVRDSKRPAGPVRVRGAGRQLREPARQEGPAARRTGIGQGPHPTRRHQSRSATNSSRSASSNP